MRTEASAFQASPLTVWVGSTRYVCLPGPDVSVGTGSQCDIRLEPGDAAGIAHPASEDLVLRFAGTHWLAIDRSGQGILVDGVRVATVDIQDGQAITIGDPQQGQQLTFHIGSPDHTAAEPASPTVAHHTVPTEQSTGPMRVPQIAAATDSPTGPIPLPPMAQREQPPVAPDIPEPPPAEPSSTFRLPLKSDARTDGVAAYQVALTAGKAGEHELLANVSFAARPGTLTAVVGPSHARNSALLDVLSGARELSSGRVTVDGQDVQHVQEAVPARIGIVPRGERLHPQLTVERALSDAAKLRLPPDTSSEHRERVVGQVLDELELTPHGKTRIRKLPPEVRRCASMAIELISRPTLLVVDEPAVGLDPAQAHHVLAMLRRQADIGCVAVVAVSSQSSAIHLHMCDEVLLLTAAGTMAFAGPPAQIGPAMGTADWPSIFARLNFDPAGAHRAFQARQPAAAPPPPPSAAAVSPPARLTFIQQTRFVAARQLRLLLAGRVYLLFLVLLPVALAALTLLIPGDSGFSRPAPSSPNAHEAVEILALLNLAAVIIGTALTIRDLAGERGVFRREQEIGLSTSAYLLAKIIVFGVAAATLAAVLTGIVIAVKGEPVRGAVLLGNPVVEVYLAVAATAMVSAIVGLAVSSLGNSLREVLPLLLPVLLASLVFAGGLITLVGTWGYDQISWFIPAQWGFAAAASTVDLRRVDALAANAQMWTHYSGWWVFDMGALLVLGALWAGLVRYRLRPPERLTRSRPRPAPTSQK
ncbi:ABC transporter [Mycobacterium sp. 1164966.3]|uniref:ATP-binding cassette domain-containing protein n=1 Tax=Mycobacterium sp. 1164966.3 TaxID=1856861 RepID=UPI0008007F04|nr:ATP-binding cassette domain-containing protein [Mycobacterium sp. 1164966.3]OBA79704.1 ABC transporter [Mycobacterium sp. 1164966.3]